MSEDAKAPQEKAEGQMSPWNVSSWLNSAKKKTLETAALVKKDLADLKDVVTMEVSELTSVAKDGLDSTVTAVKEQVQQLVRHDAGITDGVQEPINDRSDRDIVTKVEKMGLGWMKSIASVVTDTVKNLAMEESYKGEEEFTEVIAVGGKIPEFILCQIQASDGTFLDEPVDTQAFNEWKETFSIAEHDNEINELLATSSVMRTRLTQMVPSAVNYTTFWARYFYAVHLAGSFTQKKPSINDEGEKKEEKKAVVTPEETGSPEAIEKKEQETVNPEDRGCPSRSSDDWSLCSEKNIIENIPSSPSPLPDEKTKDDEKDGWLDWDE